MEISVHRKECAMFDSSAVMEKQIKTLTSISLPLSPRPVHEASPFPDDISDLHPLIISNLMVEYTAWYAYSASMEAYASAEASLIKGQLDYMAAQSYLTANAKTIEDRKMSKYQNEEYARLSQQYLEVSAKHEIIKSLTSKYDRYVWALSRVLTTKAIEEGYSGKGA